MSALTQDEYLVNHQKAPSSPYTAYQPLTRQAANPAQPIYVPSHMTTYQAPTSSQEYRPPVNTQTFEDPTKGTYSQPPPPYSGPSSLGNTAYTQDEMMFHNTPQPQYRNIQPGIYTHTAPPPVQPIYTTGTQPSYAPPTYTAAQQQPAIRAGASAICGRCGAGYPLPSGATSWRCKNCSMLNTTNGNQCVML